jgi:hypothetical protein
MNTARLIWGILSLTAAGVLVVITLVLPPDKTLQLGDSAVPWLPAAGSGLPDGWVAAGAPD